MPRLTPQKLKPLTARQKGALQMTLDGHSKAEIQERLGISQPTLWRWRTLPAWNEKLDVVLKDERTDGQGQIRTMLPLATRRLKQLIHSSTENVALGDCRTVLEAHANLVAREEQQQILAEFEQQLEALQVEVAAARPALLAEAPLEAEFTEASEGAHAVLVRSEGGICAERPCHVVASRVLPQQGCPRPCWDHRRHHRQRCGRGLPASVWGREPARDPNLRTMRTYSEREVT